MVLSLESVNTQLDCLKTQVLQSQYNYIFEKGFKLFLYILGEKA